MLLRRVIDHVREQNWTAVGIDFVIVVVGVVIGIQVANWNEERQGVEQQQRYVERLAADFRSIQQRIDRHFTCAPQKLDLGRTDPVAGPPPSCCMIVA
jgi:uncharacterized membrane-anchored protein YhcB (DUF1043 family)